MQFLVSLLACIVLGYRAKQRGRDGLKFGGGVALVLFGSSAILGFWDQAVGVHPGLWWVIAAFTVVMAWLRLEKSKSPPSQASALVSNTQPAELDAAISDSTKTQTSKPKPFSKADFQHAWAEGIAYWQQHKIKGTLNILIGIFGLTVILSLVYSKLIKPDTTDSIQGQTSNTGPRTTVASPGKFLVAPGTFSSEDLNRLLETKLPSGMPIASWANQGFGYSNRTRIFIWTDNFGTVKNVDVEQLGVRTTTGQLHEVPKFSLKYHADAEQAADILILASLKGAGSPIRLFFDGDSKYVELTPNAGEFVSGRMSGKVLEGMTKAKSLKVLHMASVTGDEIAFNYNLEELREAAAAALATLGSK